MLKSILLPVDGSSYTDSQIKYCIQVAKAFGAMVKVVSVVDIRIFEWAASMGTEGFVPVLPSTLYKEESRRILEEKAQAVLEKTAHMLKDEDVDFKTEKMDGAPADIITEFAHLVDILILGKKGEFAKWKSNVVGATLDAVVRHCNKPVLITQKEYQPIQKILFAYDGSDRANNALQLVGAFASKLQVPVMILSVHNNEQVRSKYIQEAVTYLKPYNVEVQKSGVTGNPEKEILARSDEYECDLIIVGAFGHSRIREAILGSTTEHVIRKTTTPILLSK